VLDLATGDRSAIACDCAPTGLVPIGNLVRLTELGVGPLSLVDAGDAVGWQRHLTGPYAL